MLHFNFTPDQTRFLGPSWQAQTGFGFASFLLGAVNDANQDHGGRSERPPRTTSRCMPRTTSACNDRLTVNLGLRWESTGPWSEKDGHWATYDTTIQSPKYGIPGALVYATGGSTTFEGKRDWKEFGPRLGATYKLTERRSCAAPTASSTSRSARTTGRVFRTRSPRVSAATTG